MFNKDPCYKGLLSVSVHLRKIETIFGILGTKELTREKSGLYKLVAKPRSIKIKEISQRV